MYALIFFLCHLLARPCLGYWQTFSKPTASQIVPPIPSSGHEPPPPAYPEGGCPGHETRNSWQVYDSDDCENSAPGSSYPNLNSDGLVPSTYYNAENFFGGHSQSGQSDFDEVAWFQSMFISRWLTPYETMDFSSWGKSNRTGSTRAVCNTPKYTLQYVPNDVHKSDTGAKFSVVSKQIGTTKGFCVKFQEPVTCFRHWLNPKGKGNPDTPYSSVVRYCNGDQGVGGFNGGPGEDIA